MYRAHALGADNPLAAFSGRPEPLMNYFDAEKNLDVATPLRRKDCSPICDGAAAVILTAKPQAVRVAGLGAATDTSSLLDRTDLHRLGASSRAMGFACAEAGIEDVRQLRGLVCELHDAFNSLLPIDLIDLGLVDEPAAIDALVGTGRRAAAPIDPYTHPVTGPRGSVPVNLSGGLKARGHPVGGTGLFQIAELHLQLTGRFPNERAQVPDAQIGLAHSIGGPGNNIYVTLIQRSDTGRQPVSGLQPPRRTLDTRSSGRALASELHGKPARIEAATTIHVTAAGEGPIHVALLSVGERRVFAKLDAPAEVGQDPITAMAGKQALFLVKDDGDHYFQLMPDRWDMASLLRDVIGKVWRRES
jgi:hypothetical protein